MANNLFQKTYWNDTNDFIKNYIPNGLKTVTIKTAESFQTSLKNVSFIVLPHTLSEASDVQTFINTLKLKSSIDTKIIVISFNFLWKPLLDIAEKLHLSSRNTSMPNWLTKKDIKNFLELSDFEVITQFNRFLLPIPIPIITNFVNKYVSQLPIISSLSLNTITVAKPVRVRKQYSTSIIIPTRNEEGNVKGMIKKIPTLGNKCELIFVEGGSSDDTYEAIKREIKMNKTGKSAQLFKQKGKGKGDAVRLGFAKAKNDILFILDADLTVPPSDLIKFYDCIASGKADFVNGSRLVYPMEKQAMQTLNYLGNKLFGLVFSYLIGQDVKDTLCGTKVLFKDDYKSIVKRRAYFGNFDPFGDFDLLFGASRMQLKIRDLPVRYRERIYGTTNISRFRHGLLLIKMTLFAAKKLKFL